MTQNTKFGKIRNNPKTTGAIWDSRGARWTKVTGRTCTFRYTDGDLQETCEYDRSRNHADFAQPKSAALFPGAWAGARFPLCWTILCL